MPKITGYGNKPGMKKSKSNPHGGKSGKKTAMKPKSQRQRR